VGSSVHQNSLTARHLCIGLLIALALTILSLSSPLRPQGADTVPGRLGAYVLACKDTHNLGEIPWLKASKSLSHPPYFFRTTADQRGWVSTFGPGPTWLGQLSLFGLHGDDVIDDTQMRQRSRLVATLCVAFSAFFLFVLLCRSTSLLGAALGAVVGGLSFSGLSILGQGLWQQTAALIPLILALTSMTMVHQHRMMLAAVSFFCAVGIFTRPPDVFLFLGILTTSFWQCRKNPDRLRWGSLSAGAFIFGAFPFLHWNLNYHDQLIYLGQSSANEHAVYASPFHPVGMPWVEGLAGLLISPGRGLLFFAPVAFVGLYALFKSRPYRPLILFLSVQLIVCAAFIKWWGGLTFGPRLLCLPIWLLIWATFSSFQEQSPNLKRLSVTFGMFTCLIGLIGLFHFNPLVWEVPKRVDENPSVLWERPGPVYSLMVESPPDDLAYFDSDVGPFRVCAPLPLQKIHDTDVPKVFLEKNPITHP
jgi:hypothetical protein